MIEFKCGQCGAEMEAPQSQAGGVERCPQCGSPNRVPKLARPAAVAPEPMAELSPAAPTVPHAGPLSNGPAARSARNRKRVLILAAIAGGVAVAAVGGYFATVHIARRSISGSVWLTRKNGTSDIMRGTTVAILQQTIGGKDVAEAILPKVPEWEELAKKYRDMAADSRKNMQKYGDSDGTWAKYAKDEDAVADKDEKLAAKLREIASDPPATYDTLEAYRLLKKASTSCVAGLPVSGIILRSTKTDVNGKYLLTNVWAGKYYLYGISASEAYVVEWIIPITVGLQDVTLDLFNDNAETIRD